MPDAISQKTARQIVEAVKDVCGYDINFIRPDGIIEASTDPARVGTFHEVGQMAARTGKTLEVSADDPLSGTRRGINLPFVFRGETVAVIGISGDPEEVRKFATLAQKITFLLLREREINLESRNRQAEDAYVIRALTQGEAISSSYLRYFLIARGLSETALCRTVVIRLSSRWNPANLSMITEKIRQCLKRAENSLYTFRYPSEYVQILEEDAYQKSVPVYQELASSFPEGLFVGAGSREPLRQQQRSYESAVLAARTAEKSRTFFACYDDLDLAMLLAGIPEGIRERYRDKVVSHLSDREREMLTAYFAHGCRLKETAESLFVHKNTLQYQLDGIYKATGYNPRAFADAVVLYLGLSLEEDDGKQGE